MSMRPARRESLHVRHVRPPAEPPPSAPPPPLHELLSEREEEVALLVARGLSNKEVALRLCISHWTVATHLRRMFLKLDITRRIELCALVTVYSRYRP